MVDSDNSTTLPAVTRRRLMVGAAAASVPWPSTGSTREKTLDNLLQEDPSLRLCEKWRQAHANTLTLCRQQQLLEAQLISTIGFPSKRLSRADGDIATPRPINRLWVLEPDAIQDQAVAEVTAHQARWNAMDDHIGYSRMDGMIRQSEAAEQAILSDLLQAPTTTIHGVLAKLSVILCDAENREGADDFPWPHIRALRSDLARLHGLDLATALTSEKNQNSQSR